MLGAYVSEGDGLGTLIYIIQWDSRCDVVAVDTLIICWVLVFFREG